jgi:threonine/homoserine/homoserine lactone efflux protein
MGAVWAFVGVAALVIVTPGPDTALTVRNALLGGRGAGVATAAGVALGLAVWTAAASAGLAALLVASEPAFVAVKLAGAAYLVLLGAQTLLHALRGDRAMKPRTATEGARGGCVRRRPCARGS